jgi:hypothetical protein
MTAIRKHQIYLEGNCFVRVPGDGWFDMRDLGNVFEHEGPLPHPASIRHLREKPGGVHGGYAPQQTTSLFDHLVGGRDQRWQRGRGTLHLRLMISPICLEIYGCGPPLDALA